MNIIDSKYLFKSIVSRPCKYFFTLGAFVARRRVVCGGGVDPPLKKEKIFFLEGGYIFLSRRFLGVASFLYLSWTYKKLNLKEKHVGSAVSENIQ